MLLNDFFTLKDVEHSDQAIDVIVIFNKDHSIFKGHFEGFPVVPGVCMMQLIKEILEKELDKSFTLSAASQMKFLTIINPNETSEVSANIVYSMVEDEAVNIEAKLYRGETTFFKLKAALVNGR